MRLLARGIAPCLADFRRSNLVEQNENRAVTYFRPEKFNIARFPVQNATRHHDRRHDKRISEYRDTETAITAAPESDSHARIRRDEGRIKFSKANVKLSEYPKSKRPGHCEMKILPGTLSDFFLSHVEERETRHFENALASNLSIVASRCDVGSPRRRPVFLFPGMPAFKFPCSGRTAIPAATCNAIRTLGMSGAASLSLIPRSHALKCSPHGSRLHYRRGLLTTITCSHGNLRNDNLGRS